MGLVVGRETSGRQTFNSDPVSITLSKTDLVASIPTAIYALPGDHPDRGVIPHHAVTHTIEDVGSGRDRDLEAVAELIDG